MVYTLVSDGASDQALIPILEWTLRQSGVMVDLQGYWADFRQLRHPPEGLADRIQKAIELYPCDLLFVHRDGEAQPPGMRVAEIAESVGHLRERGLITPHICVVPVRMQEAWLLIDENAIRTVAGNPRGLIPLNLPRLRDIENLPDPKDVLFNLIQTASELTGRRLKKLSLPGARLRVAHLIDDFSPLRGLRAFQSFESELRQVVEHQHWNAFNPGIA